MIKELLKEVFPIIEKNAPILASTLGSPGLGVSVAVALSILGKEFGVDPQIEDHEPLVNAIRCDALCHEKLKKIEEELKKNPSLS
jgi:hypothetical protein